MTFLTNELVYWLDDTVAMTRRPDGTVINDSFTQQQKEALADPLVEGLDNGNGDWILWLFFPGPVTLRGQYSYIDAQDPSASFSGIMQYSTDSQGPGTGTWRDVTDDSVQASPSSGSYQPKEITPDDLADSTVDPVEFAAPRTGAVAIRYFFNAQSFQFVRLHTLRLFGVPEGSQRGIVAWNSGVDEVAADDHFDFGQIAQGSSNTIDFRLKNLNDTAANDVLVQSGMTLHSMASELEFAIDGGVFSPTVTIPTIGAGLISSEIITVRRTVGGAETPDADLAAILWTPGSWS